MAQGPRESLQLSTAVGHGAGIRLRRGAAPLAAGPPEPACHRRQRVPDHASALHENARNAGLDNVELVGDLALLDADHRALDLVLSFIVFQHIPTDLGIVYLAALLRLLRPGGWGLVHLTYANNIGHLRNEVAEAGAPYRYYQRMGDQLIRFGKGPPPAEPPQEMNHYNLNEVMCLLVDNHVFRHYATYTRHAGVLGIELFFQKNDSPQ